MHPSIIDCYKELNTVIETKQTSEMDNLNAISRTIYSGTIPEPLGKRNELFSNRNSVQSKQIDKYSLLNFAVSTKQSE